MGRNRDYVIDKYTGRHALESRIKSLGLNLQENQVNDMLSRIKNNPSMGSADNEYLRNLAQKISGEAVNGNKS